MDWFLYDNDLHHEQVNYFRKKSSTFTGHLLTLPPSKLNITLFPESARVTRTKQMYGKTMVIEVNLVGILILFTYI